VKVGDLVKYIGSEAMYRDRVGVVAKLYGAIDERIDSALVHFAELKGKGRDKLSSLVSSERGFEDNNGLHPMALFEIKTLTSES
tara:strand:+ start:3244 stop:3495 length:252 start_codon:yes stop_codon:yes gene_type:complete